MPALVFGSVDPRAFAEVALGDLVAFEPPAQSHEREVPLMQGIQPDPKHIASTHAKQSAHPFWAMAA